MGIILWIMEHTGVWFGRTPTLCPYCGGPLNKHGYGPKLTCYNEGCGKFDLTTNEGI